MVTSYIDDFPSAPKKDATKPKNADRQESATKKKAPVNRLPLVKSKVTSKNAGSAASRDLNEILNDRDIKPNNDRYMEPLDREETIGIG